MQIRWVELATQHGRNRKRKCDFFEKLGGMSGMPALKKLWERIDTSRGQLMN
jgi:hypothetical protein